MRDLRAILQSYPNARDVVWVQEEPENMGAWDFVRPYLTELAGDSVRHVARPRSASPAEGSAARHAINQQALVDEAFGDTPQTRRGAEKGARATEALTKG
jgi:2-oxoglutarate dehydrogenase complex dehydrogenase (E1) component-like enzyme